MTISEDARLAVLVLAAEDMYSAQGPGAVQPTVDLRIAADWTLRGYIVGTDAIIRMLGGLALGERRVYYGLLLQSRADSSQFAAVIRGTSGIAEWVEDLEGVPKMSRWPGRVESGFQGIYDSFAFRVPGASEIPMIGAIATIVGQGRLTVAGHSLGSALATYLAYELSSALPGRVALRVWASPHPGDSTFMGAVATAIPDHAHYRNPNDIVPRVPIAFGYEHLPNTISLSPETETVSVRNTYGCSHHLLSYLALQVPDLYASLASAQDETLMGCIIRKPTLG
jgi:triacylglycerol lipase